MDPFQCEKCSKKFQKKRDLTRHLFTHETDAKVKCEICRKILKNPAVLVAHIRRQHRKSNLPKPICEICQRKFSTPSTLRSHIDTVHSMVERPRLPCLFSGCDRTYTKKSNLVNHVKMEHTENPVRFSCTLCGKECKAKLDLNRHIASHTTEKTYKCATCGKSFAQLGHLKSHEDIHKEISARTTFTCHFCSQTFLCKRSLCRHIRVRHENRRNYPCTFCDKRFAASTDLTRHVQAKHSTDNEFIHFCEQCEYKSYSKRYLAQHINRCHSRTAHRCYFCGKKFALFNDLVRHCARIHNLER